MQKIALALLIPTYNRCSLVIQTIESALHQTQAFDEIIVVDDGSTDNTTEQLLALYGNRIRTIQTSNQGVQNARNVAVDTSQCNYVTFCDSDDLLEPTYVETVKKWLDASGACQLVYTNFVTFSESHVDKDKFSQAPILFFEGATHTADFITDIPDIYARTMIFQPLFPSGMTINKSYFQQIGGFNTEFNHVGAEDWEFTLRAIAQTPPALCKLPLVRIRRHDTNDSKNNTRQSLGEAQIIEYALVHHDQAAQYAALLTLELNARRLAAFNGAYASADFATATHAAQLMQKYPASLKFYTKLLILKLPSGLRHLAWKVSQ